MSIDPGDKVEIDFGNGEIRFVLLVGSTGSGKSVFHHKQYTNLMGKYLPAELGFVFLDMTVVDFADWDPKYLFLPVITDPDAAIKALHDLAMKPPPKKIVIHIEECDMVYRDREAVEASLRLLKGMPNVIIVYSTSRIDRDYLGDWIKNFVDLKVVFSVPTEDDWTFLLGSRATSTRYTIAEMSKDGERVRTFSITPKSFIEGTNER